MSETKRGGAARQRRRDGATHAIDIHVGKRIRMRRLFMGMNLEALANRLQLSYQQVQKYERGVNRVSASRLAAIADILGVPVSFFFGDLQRSDAAATPEECEARERMGRPETIELVRLYYAIPDERVRKQFLEMVKALAASHEHAPRQEREGRRPGRKPTTSRSIPRPRRTP